MGASECCDDLPTAPYNPKLDRPKSHKHSRSRLFNWTAARNPILPQIKDTAELSNLFKKYPLVPYAGTNLHSGHSLLHFLMSMVDLSTTHGSCIISQKKFAFGGKLEIVKNSDSVFDFEEDVESLDFKKNFAQFIRGIKMNASDIKTLSENLFVSYKGTGNAYFSLVLSESLDVKSAGIFYHKPDTVLYIAPEKPTDNLYVAVSPDFTKLQEKPPAIYPVYPNFHKRGSGELVTMFHVKDSTDWYGRPDSLSSFLYQYREFQDANYLIQECDNGFTGKVMIEVEEGDPETDDVDDNDSVAGIVEQFENDFTRKGDDPLSILFMTRPKDATPAFVHEFDPNTNEKFFEISSAINERKILVSHSWSARLLGESKAAGLSTNLFTDELESKLPLLEGYQTLIESYINPALHEIAVFMGMTEFEDISIKFRTPFNVIRDATAAEGTTSREERAGVNMNRKSTTLDE